jgi:hypothetical protein
MAAKQDEEVPRDLLSATLAVAWEPDVKSRLREHEAKLVAQQKVRRAGYILDAKRTLAPF